MSEQAAQQPSLPPIEKEQAAQPADLTPAEAFQARANILAEAMPRSSEQIRVISGKAGEVAEKIKAGAIQAVDKAATDLPGEVKASSYPSASVHRRVVETVEEASAHYDPIATAQKLAAKHGVRQHYPEQDDLYSLVGQIIGGPKPKTETREYKEIVRAATDWQADFKVRKTQEAEKKIGKVKVSVPDVSEEDKAAFGEEEERAFWGDASQRLEALERIAGKSVASGFGRLASRHTIERANKFVSPDHKSATFKIELDRLDRWIKEQDRYAHDRPNRLADIYERFPQTSPINYDDAKELQPIEKAIEDLRTAIASESYLPRLDRAVAKYVAQLRANQGGKGSGNTAPQESEPPNYPVDVTSQVDAEIRVLSSQGLSSREIRRKLSAQYHPDVNEGSDPARINQLAGYVNEWYEGVIKEEQEK